MHESASICGQLFADIYGGKDKVVLDIGGKNVNGSLNDCFKKLGMKYICIDMEEDSSVDIVVKPGDKYPFEDGSIDLIVSTSCFEHDPCFWMTFREMTRLIKLGGFIYINAPSNGPYHRHPGDNWRFYSDAGQALAYWSSYQLSTEQVFPVKVVETFHILPKNEVWNDFVCVWERVDEKQTDITISQNIYNNIGILEKELNNKTFITVKRC